MNKLIIHFEDRSNTVNEINTTHKNCSINIKKQD